MEKEEIISQCIKYQEEVNRLFMDFRIEEWLSLNLTIAQLKSIVYIYSKGMVNYREIATALNVTPSVVTGIVDRLILQGLVKRTHADKAVDRRVQWLELTEGGRSVLDGLRRQTIDNMSQLLETLSEDDLASLARGLTAVVEATRRLQEAKELQGLQSGAVYFRGLPQNRHGPGCTGGDDEQET